jgi:hypothetical protein
MTEALYVILRLNVQIRVTQQKMDFTEQKTISRQSKETLGHELSTEAIPMLKLGGGALKGFDRHRSRKDWERTHI